MHLRRFRMAKGWSQAELARRAKVSQTYVALLEQRIRRNPTVAVAKRLAEALGVPLMRLLE